MSFQQFLYGSLLGILSWQVVSAQTTAISVIPLTTLEAFQEPDPNWTLAANASADFTKPGNMRPLKGAGVVVNVPTRNNGSPLVTKQEFGDLEFDLDFMTAKGTRSGLYLQGRYKIQLADSWTTTKPTFADCGGIGQRSDDAHGGYEGMAPAMNVAKAPGLWQHLKVKFRAPKFNDKGQKITNARFDEVYLNGTLIHQQANVTGPAEGALYPDEKATGPLVLQNGTGGIAFRNLTHQPVQEPKSLAVPSNPIAARRFLRVINPIVVSPEGRPYLLRSYLTYGDKKRTHVISVGAPNQVNYSYDLKQGALLQVWHGQFMDVTAMWNERGEPQLARPLGSVIALSGAPALAVLPDANTTWPDSVAFDDLQNKGYVLDKNRVPTFRYVINGVRVDDKIAPLPTGESLIRELTVTSAPDNLYCRIIAAGEIEKLGKGLYAIDGKAYYLQISDQFKPMIRKTTKGQEMLVRVEKPALPLTYSITW